MEAWGAPASCGVSSGPGVWGACGAQPRGMVGGAAMVWEAAIGCAQVAWGAAVRCGMGCMVGCDSWLR